MIVYCFNGRNKLANRWEDNFVKEQPEKKINVFEGNGKERVETSELFAETCCYL